MQSSFEYFPTNDMATSSMVATNFEQMEIFELTKFDFIELNKLLKITQLASSGGEASRLISEGHVTVNGAVETQKRKKLKAGDKVELGAEVIEAR